MVQWAEIEGLDFMRDLVYTVDMVKSTQPNPDEILARFVPQSEAARMLGLTRSAVNKMIERGNLTPHYLYGGTLTVVSVEDIEAMRSKYSGGAALVS